MNITKTQIQEIVDDLEHKRSQLDEGVLEMIPSMYMGEAIYQYTIDRLNGLIEDE